MHTFEDAMIDEGRNRDQFLREFTLVGLFLSLFVFLGNDLKPEDKNHVERADVLKTELQVDFDVLLSKHLSFPDLLSDLPIRLISSNNREDQTVFELFFQNLISVKSKVRNHMYLKFKSNLKTFYILMLDKNTDQDRPLFL